MACNKITWHKVNKRSYSFHSSALGGGGTRGRTEKKYITATNIEAEIHPQEISVLRYSPTRITNKQTSYSVMSCCVLVLEGGVNLQR
jgi:hypothetical protein